MTRAMVEPIRFGSKNPSKEELEKIEKAINEAWEERHLAPEIEPFDMSILTRDLSKEEFEKLCGF